MEAILSCPICKHKKYEFLFSARDKNHKVKGLFNLVKCEKCGLIFLNPQPTSKELEKYYPSSKYYSLDKISKDSFTVKLRIFLYDLYYNKENKNYLLKALFSPAKIFIRGIKLSKGKKLLDIGSGSGQFLYEAKQLGMDVYGVEPGNFDKKTAISENLNIKKGFLHQAKYKSNFFDVITMHHVLEHVDNPDKFLKEVRRILKKGGTLIIGVPNTHSLAFKIFGRNWYQLDVPRHLLNYSDKLLKKYLEKSGFKVEKVIYNSRAGQFFISAFYLLNDFVNIKKSSKINHFLANNIIFNLIFLPLGLLMNLFKVGDQIEVYSKKK